VALHLRGPMREHYLNWLAGVRPDLSALHRARFRSGAYQDEAERDRIADIVNATARRSGVTGRRGRLIPESPEPATPEETTSSEQLSLL
jgi:hypothetical protein